MIGYHCDYEDCDTWTNDPVSFGLIIVASADGLLNLQFCCMDHAGRYLLGHSSPVETI